jgi:hypothetical protein
MFKRVGINEQIVAGWLAGAVARTLTNPFGTDRSNHKITSFSLKFEIPSERYEIQRKFLFE